MEAIHCKLAYSKHLNTYRTKNIIELQQFFGCDPKKSSKP